VRTALIGVVRLQADKELSSEMIDTLSLLWLASREVCHLFITPETANLLHRHQSQVDIGLIRENMGILIASRYFKRWSRRLLDHGFTREDAKILGFGVFGTDQMGSLLGVDAIITLDRHFAHNYEVQFDIIQRRLDAMTVQINAPYDGVTLPLMRSPTQILLHLSAMQQSLK